MSNKVKKVCFAVGEVMYVNYNTIPSFTVLLPKREAVGHRPYRLAMNQFGVAGNLRK